MLSKKDWLVVVWEGQLGRVRVRIITIGDDPELTVQYHSPTEGGWRRECDPMRVEAALRRADAK